MAQASLTERINVPAEHFFKVLQDIEAYPQFLSNVKSARADRKADGHVHIDYLLDLFAEIRYKIDQIEDPAAGTVRWTLIESNTFKKNTGGWTVKAISPTQCEVTYALEVEFKIFVPGFVLKKLTQATLPDMMKAFSRRAEKTLKAGVSS